MADENQNAGAGSGDGGEAAAAAAAAAKAGNGAATGNQGAGDAASTAAAAEAAKTAAYAAEAAKTAETAAAAAAKAKEGEKKELGWGETWRADYAGTDEKLLKRLERYASPKAAIDALVAAQNKISSGELKIPLAKDATPEQIAEYHKDIGVPDTSKGYFEGLPQGLVFGDEDRAGAQRYMDVLHANHIPPAVAHELLKAYSADQEAQVTARIAADESTRNTVEDALRAEWGNDYRTNINSIQGLLGSAPPEVSELISNARTPDGTALMNDPKTLRWLVSLAREVNPVHTIVPGAGSGAAMGKSVEDEISTIEKFMRENRPAYNKDVKAQNRLLELYGAREKLAARA